MITCNLGLNQRAVLRYGGQIGFGLLLGCVSMGGIAQNQPPSFGGNQTSVQYQPNQYCPANTVVEIPQGAPNATLYRDSVCIREQLRPYQADDQPATVRYYAHKANAWLAYAYHEASEHSPTAAGADAMNRAVTLLSALKNNHSELLAVDSVLPATSGVGRPDLWADILAVKHSPAFARVTVLPKIVADSEVKLIWSQAENCERGWRHANEHFAAADRWVTAAYLTAWNALDADQQAALKATREAYFAQLLPLSQSSDANATATKQRFWHVQQRPSSSCQGTILPAL